MKVDKSHEIYFVKSSNEKEAKKLHDCKVHNDFADMLEKIMEKDLEDEKLRDASNNKKKTSLFAEKKTGKNKTDIFDTLIDI